MASSNSMHWRWRSSSIVSSFGSSTKSRMNEWMDGCIILFYSGRIKIISQNSVIFRVNIILNLSVGRLYLRPAYYISSVYQLFSSFSNECNVERICARIHTRKIQRWNQHKPPPPTYTTRVCSLSVWSFSLAGWIFSETWRRIQTEIKILEEENTGYELFSGFDVKWITFWSFGEEKIWRNFFFMSPN